MLAAIALTIAITLPFILWPHFDGRGRASYDQKNYHERVVRQFEAEWPTPDVGDYLSATTPGYHLALAAAAKLGLESTRALRIAGLGFVIALVGIVAWTVWVRTGRDNWFAFAVTLPLIASVYVNNSAVWLLPDNAAWCLVTLILALATRERWSASALVAMGLALVGLVLARQIHAWAAGAIYACCWMNGNTLWPRDVRELRGRVGRVALGAVVSLPAFGVLAWFVSIWGGLTPPRFQGRYGGFNWATPAFFLALLGLGSAFFLGYLIPTLGRLWREGPTPLALAALGGFIVSVIPETSYDQMAGRWTGLWGVVRMVPVFADRSPLLIAMSAWGGAMLYAWSAAVGGRFRWVMLGSIAGFVAAQTTSPELWQRYHEPFVLIVLALWAAEVVREERRAGPVNRGDEAAEDAAGGSRFPRRLLGLARMGDPAMLALLLGLITARGYWTARVTTLHPLEEIQDVIDRVPRAERGRNAAESGPDAGVPRTGAGGGPLDGVPASAGDGDAGGGSDREE
ncbi:MAG: hypothetical protein RBS39_07585 [Phycisphaerales bacterium]|nr:hypothetical protein [Phycisphaerales bacterium]